MLREGVSMDQKLVKMFGPEEIAARVVELGKEINAQYAGKEYLAVCVLKGAFMFYADLVRELDPEPVLDFIRVSSYGNSTSSSGVVTLSKDLECDIKGMDVLLVEDIVDTGLSLDFLYRELEKRGPASLRVCSLVQKLYRRQTDVKVDFSGFTVEQGYAVGYGMDCAEHLRGLRGIFDLQNG